MRGRDWLVLDVEFDLDAVVARGQGRLILDMTSNLDATAVAREETDSSLTRRSGDVGSRLTRQRGREGGSSLTHAGDGGARPI